jgi:hypothetical protein
LTSIRLYLALPGDRGVPGGAAELVPEWPYALVPYEKMNREALALTSCSGVVCRSATEKAWLMVDAYLEVDDAVT